MTEIQFFICKIKCVFRECVMYKPRRKVKGRGIAEMSILLNNDSYLKKKCLRRGEGCQIIPNFVNVVYAQTQQPLKKSKVRRLKIPGRTKWTIYFSA